MMSDVFKIVAKADEEATKTAREWIEKIDKDHIYRRDCIGYIREDKSEEESKCGPEETEAVCRIMGEFRANWQWEGYPEEIIENPYAHIHSCKDSYDDYWAETTEQGQTFLKNKFSDLLGQPVLAVTWGSENSDAIDWITDVTIYMEKEIVCYEIDFFFPENCRFWFCWTQNELHNLQENLRIQS